MTQIGERIRATRLERGLTVEALAFASGKSVATINRAENDKHQPSLTTLSAIAAALGTSVADLLPDQPTQAAG